MLEPQFNITRRLKQFAILIYTEKSLAKTAWLFQASQEKSIAGHDFHCMQSPGLQDHTNVWQRGEDTSWINQSLKSHVQQHDYVQQVFFCRLMAIVSILSRQSQARWSSIAFKRGRR